MRQLPKAVARTSQRAGYTLLEVILAAAISALLMAGLYAAMDIQFRLTQAGRETVERSTLVRALFQRMSSDLLSTLGPAQSRATTSARSSSSATGGSVEGLSNNGNPPAYAAGVVGDKTTLNVFVSRVVRFSQTTADVSVGSATPDAPAVVSDIRKVTYWLASEGGLARLEQTLVTGDDALSDELPGGDEEVKKIIADEVRSVEFRYWDGSAWQDSWDGTMIGPDGATPIGPPLAIEVRLGLAFSPGDNTQTSNSDTDSLKFYRHVIAITTFATNTAAAAAVMP